MRRSIAAGFTVFIAALLSLVVAVPANAVDPYVPVPKPGPNNQYKYGFDFYKYLTQGNPAGPSSPWSPQPVSPTVNPSSTGPAYYLDQARNRVLNPSNVPLTGKIIEPGKSIVRAPSTYKPVTTFLKAGSPFLGRFLGAAGFGIGGVTLPPGNWKQIAISQGVPQACVDAQTTGNCSGADIKKIFAINSCEHSNTCSAIGATAPDNSGSPFGDWFKDTALPFLDDLWGQITGQQQEGDVPDPNGHYKVVPKGCSFAFDIEYRGANNITLHPKQTIVSPQPTQAQSYTGNIYWGQECSNPNTLNISDTVVRTTCMDNTTGLIVNGAGASNGYSQGINAGSVFDPTTHQNKTAMCVNTATQTLVMVQVINTITQSNYDAISYRYNIATYTQWLNPDPKINFIEDTKITTTWDCRAGDGTIFSFTRSVDKIAAAVQPSCPAGSELVKHKIESKTGAQDTRTLDEGAETPGAAAAYPNCLGLTSPGCTMDVYVDGTKCTSTRTECATWPNINSTTPSRVQCRWGSYTMPTTDCLSLSNGYKSESGVVFDPHSGAWTAVDIYGNPQQANPEPWNSANPNPTPGTNIGTTPTTGTNTGTPGFPTTGTNPSVNDNCTAPTWSWNPTEFVKNPVVCALAAAYVPQTDFAARGAEIQTILLDKPPMNWLVPPPMTGPGGAGCPNWVISIPGFLSENVVCESSFTSAVLGARGPLFGLVSAAMVWPLMRSIWYAAIPVLRVTPGGSK
jgi:hypothetical protein